MKNAIKSLIIVAFTLLSVATYGETMYVVSGKCNIPLTAGMNNAKYQIFTWDGSTATATTDISCDVTGTGGSYYNSTSLALSDLKTLAKYNASSSSTRTMQAIKLAGGVKMTISLGSKTMSKAIVVGRANSTDNLTINILGENQSTNSKDFFIIEKEQTFSGSIIIENTTSKEYNFFVYLIEGAAGPVAVTGVALNKTSTSIEAGQTEQLTATVAPDNAENKSVTWSSSNTAVATVDDNGLVSALSAGEATITVTTADGGKTATCAVTVTAPATPLPVTAIALNNTEVAIGGTATLTVTYTPADANTGKAITSWTSSDETVATVANGVVTGVSAGTATITATTEGGKEATCTVTVKEVAVTGVSLDKSSANLQIGGTTTLTATVTPANATDKSLTWTSSDETVASVDANGKVTAIAEGIATITVTTTNGAKTATCEVTVTEASPLPQTGLTAHAPEIYEEPSGYNTPLSQFDGREYEVYYVTRDPSGNNICIATNTNDKVAGISTGTTNTVKARDNWFELKESNGKGGDTGSSAKDEFKLQSVQCIKMHGGHEMIFQVKGFDQFNFYGKDNNKDATKGRQFEVYIDETKVSGAPIDGYVIHRYDMTPAEHVIRLVGIGDSDSKLTGFSLRVSDDPLVRHVGGPKAQTVYQTKPIERIAFRVRRAASHRLVWKNDKAIPGVSLTEGTNDSVYVEGLADAAAGLYTYTIEALNAAGEVKSSETGTIIVQTHIFDSKSNNQTVNVAEEIQPIRFVFYGLDQNDITLSCDIEGLAISFPNDSTCELSGAPAVATTEGDHNYTLSIAGGNSVQGTITVVVPDPIFEAIAEAKVRDGASITFTVEVRHAETVTQTGLPDDFVLNYDKATNTLSITGTPNVGSPYPKTINYTLTATPRYDGKQNAQAQGKLIVIDPNAKAILVACKNLKEVSDEPAAAFLATQGYDITFRKQNELAGSSIEAFDLVLISENADADNTAVLDIIRNGEKPILNMNGFTYASGRLSWGEPNNGTLDTITHNGQFIYVQRGDHPIFQKLNKKDGDKIRIFDKVERNGVMPIKIDVDNSFCLATAYTRDLAEYYKDGELQTVLHEIPADMRNGQKYICLPIKRNVTLSNDGKNLLDAIVAYLLDESTASIELPELAITRFVVEGIEGDIDDNANTIKLKMTQDEYKALDSLRTTAATITLADSKHTFVTPASGDSVSLLYSSFIPTAYVVSDYINRRVYNVSIVTYDPRGIDEVYSAGQWVNLYDIYGRLVATTNEDIYTIALPRGMYIALTEDGKSIKIMR